MAATVAASEEIDNYFKKLTEDNDICYAIANKARSRGKDPKNDVEIPQAEDLASRVEKLLSDYNVEGIAEDIRRLTKKYENREIVSLMIAKEIANKPAENREKAIDRAVRVGLAVLTEGILVAPLEGIANTRIRSNPDGSEYIDLIFAGPIRAAGGTGQAMSVLIADVVRQELGIGKYIPTTQETDRFIEEIPLYKQCQHLQYTPSAHEIQLIVGNCPICIDGEGTEKMEISGFRDLPRIETNQVRGGACLVIAEGLCQKAAKIKKHVDKLELEGWDFISEYLASKNISTNGEDVARSVVPSDKYLKDIVAGRPIFGHPSVVGGFRLRYGRGRTCGLAALAFSPASMYVLDEFPALGTQIKIERPGKACVVTPCDELDGPIVLLKNGDLVQCNTKEEALEVRPKIVEITDCGEVLIPFGEFCENNHFLIPCGYPIEWHKQELLKKGNLPEDWKDPTWERSKQMSREIGVPLHPKFNLFWSDVNVESLNQLKTHIINNGNFINSELQIPKEKTSKRTLEDLGALHTVHESNVIIGRYALPLIEGLGLRIDGGKLFSYVELVDKNSLDAVSKAMGFEVRARATTRIGMRMARPEKAKDRKGAPVIHGLFPVGDNPKYKKEVITAIQNIKQSPAYPTTHKVNVSVEAGKRICPKCQKETYRTWCRECCAHTDFITAGSGFEKNNEIIELNDEYQAAMKTLGLNSIPEVKVMDRLISKIKAPEALEKAILRAKYDLGTYKDGTIRFDMTDIPITHFRPREIELTVEKAVELGYTHDMDGNPLTNDEQLCELKVQDIIPNTGCGDYLVIVATYVDHLLEKFYDCDKFYNLKNRQELIGQLGVGLAPHTSGGILCRIIGYTTANGCYAHPFFHAAKRRNCDGDEDSVILLLDCLINFSRTYLPDRRGGLMDAPLVLTTRLDPNEIDKEAHNLDCLREYPLEFYEAAMSFKDTKEIEKSMDLIAGRIGTPQQYEGLKFTHDTKDISEGPKQSAYTTLETMMDKMEAQLYLGKKIRAVDEKDVATRVINKHFLPDMTGNLRSFSTQGVRCNECGAKYRRVPLTGRCTTPNASKPSGKCGNSLVLSVYEASVKKYLAISQEIGRKYELSDYTKERIDILEMSMNSLFNNDKVRKCKLSDFF